MQPKQQGIVFFDTQPHGAQIIIDGQILTDPDTEESLRTPERVLLFEGRRDFILRLEGHNDEIGYVDVFPGVTVNIFRNLTPGTKEEWAVPEPQIWLSTEPSTEQTTDQSQLLYEVKSMNMGNITITTNPGGANIFVDGTLMTYDTGNPVTTPVTLILNTGSRFIEIYKEGYEIDYHRVYVYEGANIIIESNLFPKPYYMSQIPEYAPEKPKIPYYVPTVQSMECPSATEGIVVITTYPPGATIIMDGKTLIDMDTGEPLMTPVDLAVEMGFHDLQFKLKGFFDEFDAVYVEPRYHQYRHKNFNVCQYIC